MTKPVVAKRHQKMVGKKNPTEEITKSDIRRIARRAGALRINGTVFPAFRKVIGQAFMSYILHDAVLFMMHSKRKTIMESDIAHAFERAGQRITGGAADRKTKSEKFPVAKKIVHKKK